MPVLGPHDELSDRPARILVGGTSGAGKSRLGRELSRLTGIAYIELDALHHGPKWTVRPEFDADVAALSRTPEWITDYQYSDARPVLLAECDLVVYLLLPRSIVLRRVVTRTVRRAVSREVLWNGNVEPPLRTIFSNRDHIIRWAWRTHGEGPRRLEAIATERPALPVVALRSPREIRTWLEQVATTLT